MDIMLKFDARSLSAAIRALDNALKAHILSLDDSSAKQPLLSSGNLKPQTGAIEKTTQAGVNAKKTGNADAEDEAPKEIKRNDKVTVYIHIIFMKIGNIDTIHDRFTGEALVTTKWREPMLDGRKLDSDSIDWTQYWNPKLSLENGIGDPKSTSKQTVSYDRNGRATVTESRHFIGTFFEYMELYHFPFDQQDLTVTVVSDRDTTELQLVEDPEEKCGINGKAFSAEQEWELHKTINVWKKTVTKKANKMVKKHPGFSCAAKASRRPQFFIWNIIIIMSTICSMAFATFTVSLNAPQSRLPLTFILLLTTVTFKFVVNKSLPRISYLTYMDKYILGMMVILNGVCIWHAIVAVINNNTKSLMSSTTIAPTSTTTTLASIALAGCPNVTATTAAAAAASSASAQTITLFARNADSIALGIFVFLFIGLHLIFVFLIGCCNGGDDDKPENADNDADSSEDVKEDSRKQLVNDNNSNNKTVVAFNNGAPPVYNNLAQYTADRKNGKVNRPAIG